MCDWSSDVCSSDLLLSCIGSVVMFFIMDTLAQGSGFDSMIGKDTILAVMGMGTYIIGLFAVIFLIYSNSFLAKNFDYPEKPLKYKHIRRISD